MASCNVRGPALHYLGNATNPAVSRALLVAVAHLLDLELDVTPFEAAVRAFRTRCDQAVARLLDLELDVSPLDAAVQAFRSRCDQAMAGDAATQAYVRQLEQAYDATGDEPSRPHRDDAFHPEQLMHELEDFLRQERDRGAE